jgi:Mce-associated membrane protein
VSANLYDLLNVEESASTDEIRAAWKDAIADLDPTAPRFRAFSDAAGVLLDGERRASYDAELAAERAAREPEPQAEPQPEPEPEIEVAEAPAPTEPTPTEPAPKPAPSGPPGWALGAAAVGALAAVVLALVLYVQPGGKLFSGDSPKDIAERNTAAERDTVAAEGAAERMVAPVFSYGYQTMTADLQRVTGYLTPKLAAKQTRIWPELTDGAQKQQLTVQAASEGAALTRLSKDGKLASVVVFIRQDSTRKGGARSSLHMWATLTLVRSPGADQGWLLDDICVDAGCA